MVGNSPVECFPLKNSDLSKCFREFGSDGRDPSWARVTFFFSHGGINALGKFEGIVLQQPLGKALRLRAPPSLLRWTLYNWTMQCPRASLILSLFFLTSNVPWNRLKNSDANLREILCIIPWESLNLGLRHPLRLSSVLSYCQSLPLVKWIFKYA